MQPSVNSIVRIARKEITLFFASPIAYLFLATFAAVTLFVFFWGEAFFARNIADVRPLFEWMPVLLIFLSATLTMRLWSEERRTGTLETVLTQPVPLWYFVLGKFIGCLVLLCIALAITLPLPITVAIIGDLDWGPVFAGYLATLLMGAAYLAMGLFVSARAENQIVSLIIATALCGAFYLVGHSTITSLFGNEMSEWLRLFGTGSRFESITRGVIDARDLVYYISLILIFLSLNAYVLEKERWVYGGKRPMHRRWKMVTGLLVVNALIINVWLNQIQSARMDITEGRLYSISDSTRQYLNQLQEPLLVRGYFSNKTHPLLAPLVPQLRDLIEEYQVAGGNKVRVEIIDPTEDPEAEKEANQKYGIQPVPFQVADRYQAAIVSSYFNVLIQYGEEFQVLGFQELIEVKAQNESNLDVQLRNPEHDLTRAIKKVLASYQSGGNLFASIPGELTFTGYISNEDKLPEQLQQFKLDVQAVVDEQRLSSNSTLSVNFVEPEAEDGRIAQKINADYGFLPMSTSVISGDSFYFYLTLDNGEQLVQIPMDDLSQESFKRNFEAGLKRFAKGFTKTVALVVPETPVPQGQPHFAPPSGPSFNQLQSFLGAELTVEKEDISDGSVSGEADILVLAAPDALDDKQLFAVDQFLMKGGTVIVATSPYSANLSNQGLAVARHNSGMQDWLAHNGITIEDSMVLDRFNTSFPLPVTRNVGGFQLQDFRMIDYPYFIDVRAGLNSDSLVTSELPQMTLAWASPITVVEDSNRSVTELVASSEKSWLSSNTEVMPKWTEQGITSFSAGGEQTASHLLAVVSEGRFDSYFADKDSPLLNDSPVDEVAANDENPEAIDFDEAITVSGVINRSPSSARLFVIASNDFWRDQVLQLASGLDQNQYLNSLQFAANAIDWSLEDSGLLSIRSRGHFNRTLPPMETAQQAYWEYSNYGLAALALLFVAGIERLQRRRKMAKYQQLLAA